MLGNWSFALRWDDPSGWMVRAYWQHVFEDHSMLFFDYPWKDGLYGVEARFPKTASCRKSWQNCSIQRIRPARSIGTMCLLDVQISSRDNYFNHYIYSGWENWEWA